MDTREPLDAAWVLPTNWFGQLDAYGMFSLVVGCAMLIIAVALALASHHADGHALRLFAVRYALAALGWWFAHPRAHEDSSELLPLAPLLVALALQALTIHALDAYLDQAGRQRTRGLLGVAAVALAALLWLRQALPGDPLPVYLLILLSMSWCAWQSAAAARRERNVGLAWVAAAFASYPLLMGAALLQRRGSLQEADLSYVVALPGAFVGVAILVVSLIRAVQRTRDALSSREAARAALQEANQSLEVRVAARTRELRDLVHGLEGFNRQVSHDLRGPLAGLSGLSRLAIEQLGRGETERVAAALSAMAEQGQQLQAMVDDLLTLSRTGSHELVRRAQPMRPVVDEAIEQLRLSPRSAADLRRIELSVGELPTVKADPGLLRQAWVNLLSNAVRFARQAQGEGKVEVGVRQVDGETRFYVADNGPGFPPARAPDLFEAFGRLHGGGLSLNGIGLSIVRRIVEHHGGRAWAESDGRQGATFWFTLEGAARESRPT